MALGEADEGDNTLSKCLGEGQRGVIRHISRQRASQMWSVASQETAKKRGCMHYSTSPCVTRCKYDVASKKTCSHMTHIIRAGRSPDRSIWAGRSPDQLTVFPGQGRRGGFPQSYHPDSHQQSPKIANESVENARLGVKNHI